MTWWTKLLGYLPNVSMMHGVALAFSAGVAIGGWSGYKIGTSQSYQDKALSLERAIDQMAEIARQDAEILSATATKTRIIYQERDHAHDTLSASAVPDCQLHPDGLRAVQSVYPAGGAHPGAAPGTVRSAGSAIGWPDVYDFSLVDRGGVGVPSLRQ